MLYVALGELALLAVVTLGFLSLLRAQNHSHARREDVLLDKALHAAGRPWTPAPADEPTPRTDFWDEDGDLVLSQHYARFTTSPEQEP